MTLHLAQLILGPRARLEPGAAPDLGRAGRPPAAGDAAAAAAAADDFGVLCPEPRPRDSARADPPALFLEACRSSGPLVAVAVVLEEVAEGSLLAQPGWQ